MAIRVTCGCGNEFRAGDAYAGKAARCPRCRKSAPVLAKNAIPPEPAGMPPALLAIDTTEEEDEMDEPASPLKLPKLPPHDGLERLILRAALYLLLAVCSVNRMTQGSRAYDGTYDVSREAQTVWLVGAVALAALAASSGRRSS